jgi:hypothetical protein
MQCNFVHIVQYTHSSSYLVVCFILPADVKLFLKGPGHRELPGGEHPDPGGAPAGCRHTEGAGGVLLLLRHQRPQDRRLQASSHHCPM